MAVASSHQSFIDGRVHLFGEAFVRDYRKTFLDSHWEERLAPFDIKYLLLSKDGGQTDSTAMVKKARASGNWTVLFEDNVSILFARKKGLKSETPAVPVAATKGPPQNNMYTLLLAPRPAGKARATRTGSGGPAMPGCM
jgi:hypothetical protein